LISQEWLRLKGTAVGQEGLPEEADLLLERGDAPAESLGQILRSVPFGDLDPLAELPDGFLPRRDERLATGPQRAALIGEQLVERYDMPCRASEGELKSVVDPHRHERLAADLAIEPAGFIAQELTVVCRRGVHPSPFALIQIEPI